LFHSQFYPEQKGYASHEEWLSDRQVARNSQFFVLGSKDESAGSQGCVATVAEDGNIALRLRLPNAFPRKYILITGLWFAHGHNAICRNLSDKEVEWQAISYRFVKDDKGWRIFVTVSLPEGNQSYVNCLCSLVHINR